LNGIIAIRVHVAIHIILRSSRRGKVSVRLILGLHVLARWENVNVTHRPPLRTVDARIGNRNVSLNHSDISRSRSNVGGGYRRIGLWNHNVDGPALLVGGCQPRTRSDNGDVATGGPSVGQVANVVEICD